MVAGADCARREAGHRSVTATPPGAGCALPGRSPFPRPANHRPVSTPQTPAGLGPGPGVLAPAHRVPTD